MRNLVRTAALALVLSSGLGCQGSRSQYPSTQSGLHLDRVVLYRNGVGYFERVGEVDGDVLRVRVRKDQVNDLLKSLTVVERHGGKAVSVSMPLDPQSWANAALATLAPGRGNLAEVLDSLRGTKVNLSTSEGSFSGRIVMVEAINDEPDENPGAQGIVPPRASRDHRITLLDDDAMKVVRLSKVKGITLEDGDLAMQLNRTLDSSAGEGMFQQIEVAIRLTGEHSHDLLVSYVVSAPMWKPTYRVVLPKDGKGKALLQGWAVVDNTSGEDWGEVSLGLTSGAPIAFRYDLHTPRDVFRTDLTEAGVEKHAEAMIGETSYGVKGPMGNAEVAPADEPAPDYAPAAAQAAPAPVTVSKGDMDDSGASFGQGRAGGSASYKTSPAKKPADGRLREEQKNQKQEIDLESLRRSTLAAAKSASASGLTRFDLDSRVTVPQGTSTMVAVINSDVEGEETFLFKPGGAGRGYETNPYRVVRFKNSTPFVLEPGPISIYSGGSFVGEGLSESVGSNTSATIPFAVESGIMVSSIAKADADEMRLIKISRGVLEIESFGRVHTTWTVKSQTREDGFDVLIRHPKAGWNYTLSERPEGTEDLPDAFLLKVKVPKGQREGSLSVTEQTPSRREISIWDSPALPLLEKLLVATDLPPATRTKLQPIIDRRREIGRIDEQIEGLERQKSTNDQRAYETRENLKSIEKNPQANDLRTKLTKKLDEFASEGNKLGTQLADLQRQRMEKRIDLEDMLQSLDLTAPANVTTSPATPKR